MSRVKSGSDGLMPCIGLSVLGAGFDLEVNQPPSLPATPGEEVWLCIVDVLLRRVRGGRRVKDAVGVVSILPYARSISYSSCSGEADRAGDGKIPTLIGADVPLNQLSMTDLEVCLVLLLLAVVSLVLDAIKLASDLVGEDAPEAGTEEQLDSAGTEQSDEREFEFVALAISGILPRNAFVIPRYDSPWRELSKSDVGEGPGQYRVVSLAVLAVAG
jgi:hypothetical protein